LCSKVNRHALEAACLAALRALEFNPGGAILRFGSADLGSPRAITWRAIVATGTVKWFNPTKGFGFIQPDDGGNDVFVHISAVERSSLGSIHEGQKLGYELERDQRSGKMSAGQLQAA